MTNRTRIIEEVWFRAAQRKAVRAAVKAFEAEFSKRAVRVDEPALTIAAGRLEDVSTFQLRSLLDDVTFELHRRGEGVAHAPEAAA